jgi:hypothetical protein
MQLLMYDAMFNIVLGAPRGLPTPTGVGSSKFTPLGKPPAAGNFPHSSTFVALCILVIEYMWHSTEESSEEDDEDEKEKEKEKEKEREKYA